MSEVILPSDKHYPVGEHGLDGERILQLAPIVNEAELLVRTLINVPDKVRYAWLNEDCGRIVPGLHVGALAYKKDIVSIAIDSVMLGKNQKLIEKNLKNLLFHELFHLAQGVYAYDNNSNKIFLPYIDEAVYEGAASVFERDFSEKTNTLPYYADYTQHSKQELASWLEIIIAGRFKPESNEYRQWKFYHEELGVNHILYKVGAWKVDKALESSGKSIIDFSKMTAKEIMLLT